MVTLKAFLICVCIVMYNIEVLINIQHYNNSFFLSWNMPTSYLYIIRYDTSIYVFDFFIDLEYCVAHKYKTWYLKWDRSLRCLLWILCKSTSKSIRIARCHSIKSNSWKTRIWICRYNEGCFWIGRRSKINILLVE